ncbi:MAG TPA: pyridoxal phosphate-dependent aminotransferase [Thermoanaerobaculia bacterium]|jgi:aminotransferase|nr:pyridoxal phosphate-dependent aminotransferase [Thermoanaerobaculia bacterium]
MATFLSRRLHGLAQSDIRRMSRECESLGGINLAQGNCDLPVPPLVRDPAVAAINGQKNWYTFPEGIKPLREAIASKVQRHNGLTVDPISEVVITVGATGAFACAVQGLLNPGDGVIVMEPYYGYHLNILLTVGLEPHYLPLAPPRFELREEEIRKALRPNTRAVIVCTPSNPSGKMFTREELQAVARVAHEHDLLVITDEIYEYIRYDGRPHISPASVDGLWERSVTIMGLSKTFSVTGWRLGYAVAPEPMARAMTLINDLYYVCAPTPLQHGVVEGVQAPEEFFDGLQSLYQRKRDMICEALADSGLSPIVPEGAYYVLTDISQLGFATAQEAAMELLRSSRVAAVPGTAFYRGSQGEGILRFCFAKEDAVIEEACKRLRSFRPVAA